MLASQKKFALIALALALGTSGCGDRELRPLNPCTISGVQIKVPVENIDKVDLLFMIDNSGSMREEQASLAMEIPRLVRVLASGMLTTPSGETQTFPAVRDLRVAVVSSDMGTGGHTVATCSEPNFGDDGILRPTAGCGTGDPRYLGFRPDSGGDPGQFGTEVACVANLGTSGCGFEQQLDAVLKAVTPGTSDTVFINGTRGHAGAANNDFVREDSLLAIIMLTDEDDCSAQNPDIFNRGSSQFPGDDLNLRCYQYGAPEFNAVYPVQRYVDGLLAVHPPSRLVFGAIVGIPTRLVAADGEPIDYAGILSDPSMVEMPSTTTPGLVPSCDTARGRAYPPRRIVQVAQGLEQREVSSIIQSICQESYTGALNAIIAKIADVLNATCLPRALNQDSEGRVTCDIVEVLPTEGDITRCDQLSAQGRVFRERNAAGAEICTICQTNAAGNVIDNSPECQALGSNLGWFYESELTETQGCPPERPQRISFHMGAEPNTGSTIKLECLQTAAAGEGDVNIGTGCGGAMASICDTADRAVYPPGLICDAQSNTCQMACTSTDFCRENGLGGYVCYDDSGDGNSLCVNPTCD